ncbi:hypothetical protein ACJJTC_006394 [Scirpophaga incertulas]
MSTKKPQTSKVTMQNQLIQWINEAGMAEGNKKAGLLRKIIELLLHSASQMIPVYMDNVLSYVSDKSNDAKKIVISFIEEISNLHPHHLPKVIGQLRMLITDTVIAVQKRAIQAASIVYRNTLIWICKSTANESEMQYVWENLTQVKLLVLNMIDSDNEGIRTYSIKFLEEVVLLQSHSENAEDVFSLDNLPVHLPFINRRALEEESEHIFTLLIKFHNSQHISSVNLMACMTTLCMLAKFRPKFMPRVIQALGDLHTTLPPTLSQSQVNSVRKQLKMLLIKLIKHPSSNEMMSQLTQLLIDIGMNAQEIGKVLPKDRKYKRLGEIKNVESPAKRIRLDSPQSNSQGSDSNSRSDFTMFEDDNSQIGYKPSISEDSILDGLNNVENVVSLVVSTLLNCLPTDMPADFMTSYKPIPNSGTKIQKKNLAKMILATIRNEPVAPSTPPLPPSQPQAPSQLQAQPQPPMQPSLSDLAAKIPLIRDEEEKITLKNAVAKLQESTKADRQVENALSRLMEETRQEHLKEEERKAKDKEKPVPPQTPTVPKLKQKVKLLKLQEITRPIPKEIKERLLLQAVGRILRAEKESAIGGAAQIRTKFISIFASSYTPEIRDLVQNYILEDPMNRIELGLSWLFEEYAFMQGFNRHPITLYPKVNEKHDQNYNQLLCTLITQICERGDPTTENSKEVLLRKIYSEAPVVTQEAVDYLKHLIIEDKVAFLALEILEELCLMRPPRAHKYVVALVCHVLNENEEIRETCIKSVLKIYERSSESVKNVISKHALLYLGFISLSSPPQELFHPEHRMGRVPWSDELFRRCLNLVMALFPRNEELIIEVARVYGCAGSDAKRVVLRVVEAPVRAAIALSPNGGGGGGGSGGGDESEGEDELALGRNPDRDARALRSGLRPAFAALLDECPRGAETLLTRLVHIFTEKSPPSPELVSRVRELYATRVSDVRFLIPVLTGLSKKEILAALPKLIKLNPVVVKEVFNKLLGLQNPKEEPPIAPVELMIALHLIDPSQADLKYIIKATALCFGEKNTYTEDVLSSVLQRLAEEIEIPVLMMRTVLQALTLYPALAPLVLNVLQLLTDREVWLNKVAWEGWVKCCERLLPTSAFLVAALPPRALQHHALPPALLAARTHCLAQVRTGGGGRGSAASGCCPRPRSWWRRCRRARCSTTRCRPRCWPRARTAWRRYVRGAGGGGVLRAAAAHVRVPGGGAAAARAAAPRAAARAAGRAHALPGAGTYGGRGAGECCERLLPTSAFLVAALPPRARTAWRRYVRGAGGGGVLRAAAAHVRVPGGGAAAARAAAPRAAARAAGRAHALPGAGTYGGRGGGGVLRAAAAHVRVPGGGAAAARAAAPRAAARAAGRAHALPGAGTYGGRGAGECCERLLPTSAFLVAALPPRALQHHALPPALLAARTHCLAQVRTGGGGRGSAASGCCPRPRSWWRRCRRAHALPGAGTYGGRGAGGVLRAAAAHVRVPGGGAAAARTHCLAQVRTGGGGRGSAASGCCPRPRSWWRRCRRARCSTTRCRPRCWPRARTAWRRYVRGAGGGGVLRAAAAHVRVPGGGAAAARTHCLAQVRTGGGGRGSAASGCCPRPRSWWRRCRRAHALPGAGTYGGRGAGECCERLLPTSAFLVAALPPRALQHHALPPALLAARTHCLAQVRTGGGGRGSAASGCCPRPRSWWRRCRRAHALPGAVCTVFQTGESQPHKSYSPPPVGMEPLPPGMD